MCVCVVCVWCVCVCGVCVYVCVCVCVCVVCVCVVCVYVCVCDVVCVCVYTHITFQGTYTLFTEFSTHTFIYTSTLIFQCHKSTNLRQILGAFAKLRKATIRSEVKWSGVELR